MKHHEGYIEKVKHSRSHNGLAATAGLEKRGHLIQRLVPPLMILLAGAAPGARAQTARPPAGQNPSPMVETTRAHERIGDDHARGTTYVLDGVLPVSVTLFVPERASGQDSLDIIVHFHGSPPVPIHAIAASSANVALAVVNLGSGSSAYERPFQGTDAFERLLDAAADSLRSEVGNIYLTAFSAGYGSIRALISEPSSELLIDGVLLMDGLHTAYIPDRTVLSEGGRLDDSLLAPFVGFAKKAVDGSKSFVITHSEIFPGTFASTTETTDFLLDALGMKRTAVLKWGPVGMQQLSESTAGAFTVLGFAGNTAPDHVDHLHGMGAFLPLLLHRRP